MRRSRRDSPASRSTSGGRSPTPTRRGPAAQPIDVGWEFADADADAVAADFAASIDWGDGTNSPGSVSSSCIGEQCFFLVGASHTYATGGTFTAIAHVTDLVGRDDGGGSTVDIANTVHVGACL